MHLIRSTWDVLWAFIGRRSPVSAFVIGLVAIPVWALTVGLLGLLFEVVGRLDVVRVGRAPGRRAAPTPARWSAAGASWVLAIAVVGAASSPSPGQAADASAEAARPSAAIVAAAPTDAPTPSAAADAVSPTSDPTASPQPTPTPEPTPTAAPTPVIATFDEAVEVGPAERVAFRGAIGTYTWTALSFPEAYAIVRWDVRAGKGDCHVKWAVDADGERHRVEDVVTEAGETAKGNDRFRTAFAAGAITLYSNCPKWTVTLEGDTPPPPTPRPTLRPTSDGGGGNCHPSYRDACLKKGAGDYDCASGSGNGPNYVSGPIRVVGPDDFDLDRDGNGIGCENG